MAQQRAVEWLIDRISIYIMDEKALPLIEQAKAMEEQLIRDAIMYALDEDGHTGDWKIKFANDYINKYYENSTHL